MARVGGLSSKFYRETKGIKVTSGQTVKAGTVLTRQGHKWQPGINVIGQAHLNAGCDGEIYFTRKKDKSKKIVTYINVRALQKA